MGEASAEEFVVVQEPVERNGSLREKRFLDFLKASPPREWLQKLSRSSRSLRRMRVPFTRKIDWPALLNYVKRWLRNPLNIALLIWVMAVCISFLFMGMISIGLMNGVIKESSRRKEWVEACNQIMNALFTIMCVYQYPKLLHHLILAVRWKSDDATALRMVYSKKGQARPRERLHIALVIGLLHMTCVAQFTLCGLFWAYDRSSRPDLLVNACLAVGILAPIAAAVYTLYGPLSRKIESGLERETTETEMETGCSRKDKRVIITRPEWVGGLLDCSDDLTVGYLSFFCTFCVFGWNMERLGFGNMYVHILTFIFLVLTPLWVFSVTGLHIDDHGVKEAVGVIGVLLCFLGLLYGAFWRIQMRKKFKLPGNFFFWGYPNIADALQWLFCWSCALAQEVRTGNFYDVEEGRFYGKNQLFFDGETEEGEERPALQPLSHEGAVKPLAPPPMHTMVKASQESRQNEIS
ncbi:uncharacterized protein LOC144714658 [Wolffia australiana]